MNILLALDSSETYEVVVDEVTARPWPAGTKACVLTVAPSVEVSAAIKPAVIPRLSTAKAEAFVKSVADQLASRGIESSTAVIQGYPKRDIAKYAGQWKADFIFVGSRGLTGLPRFLLGSVTQALVRHAPCSVAVVRKGPEKGAGLKLVLGTDGSEWSKAAAQSVRERPWPEGSEVRVISAVPSAVAGLEPWFSAPEVIARLQEDELNRARDAVKTAEAILSGSAMKVSGSVTMGYPKSVILDEAESWKADLIVVGSQGRSGVDRLLLGSVAEAVATHAQCSVEVIKR